jgi:hypothetical protein
LTQDQIVFEGGSYILQESIADKKLGLLEAEYALVKKYDDPNYNKVDLAGETIEQLK